MQRSHFRSAGPSISGAVEAVAGSQLSSTNLVGRVLADSESRQELEELLTSLKDGAKELMQENQHVVEALRDALLERHELVGSEILDVIEDANRTVPVLPAQQRS